MSQIVKRSQGNVLGDLHGFLRNTIFSILLASRGIKARSCIVELAKCIIKQSIFFILKQSTTINIEAIAIIIKCEESIGFLVREICEGIKSNECEKDRSHERLEAQESHDSLEWIIGIISRDRSVHWISTAEYWIGKSASVFRILYRSEWPSHYWTRRRTAKHFQAFRIHSKQNRRRR